MRRRKKELTRELSSGAALAEILEDASGLIDLNDALEGMEVGDVGDRGETGVRMPERDELVHGVLGKG